MKLPTNSTNPRYSLFVVFITIFLLLPAFTYGQIKQRVAEMVSQGSIQTLSIDLTQPDLSSQKSTQDDWKKKVDPFLLWPANTTSSWIQKKDGLIGAEDDRLIRILVRVTDESSAKNIPGLDLSECSPRGNICIGYLNLDDIQTVAGNPSVLKMEASRIQRALHYNSRALIGVDKVHLGQELPQAYKGEDVIVGVIDSGIDFDHPDFQGEDGTRLLYLLEYSATQPEPFIWTKTDIDQKPEEVTQIDGAGGSGHGTHVTGSAAGGGKTDPDFTGMAPESDIIFVKGIRDHQSDGGFLMQMY